VASWLHLNVLTPAEMLLQVEKAEWVRARLADGAGISIYPGHAPLLAETVTAALRYSDALGEHAFDARAGILQIRDNHVTVFTSGGSQTAERLTPSAVSEERRFTRLAEELQARLETEDSDVLEIDREES
jgi:F0F1-type ATP synthase epsilon subunit